MTTDRASAEKAFERFLASESRFCLIEGTAQMGKLGIAVQGLMRRHPKVDSFLASLVGHPVLFRTVTFDAAEQFLSGAINPNAFRLKLLKDHRLMAAGLTIHLDTFVARTWTSTPQRVDYAIVFLPERLSASKIEECMADIMGRQPAKVIFCTLADTVKADLAWVHSLAPARITYHLKDENPAGHADALKWCKPEDYFAENE